MVVLSCIIVPIEFCFDIDLNYFFTVFDSYIEPILFFVDILINFNTGIYIYIFCFNTVNSLY